MQPNKLFCFLGLMQGIVWLGIGFACLPKPPAYPFQVPELLRQEAQALSDRLEAYIRLWYQGQAAALLPPEVLPEGYNQAQYQKLRLVRYEDLRPEQIWVTRPAHTLDFTRLYGSFPDPHCTYLLAPVLYAPFGAQLHIEGEFPYCRFFDIQVAPPFSAEAYRYDKWSGNGEVAIVDADIVPKPGHQNPFLPGANRLITQRSYSVVYEMARHNSLKPDSSQLFPYRAAGHLRYGSGIQLQGPWGLDKKSGHGRGIWDFGDVWIRYFGIDHHKMPHAGVALPTMYFKLPTGEKFFIVADFEGLVRDSETTQPNRNIGNRDPSPYHGPQKGWDKQFGIFLQISSGLSIALYKEKPADKAYVRALDLGVNGRGENQPPPSCYEPHATACNYTGYLTTGMSIQKGKVFILAGKTPHISGYPPGSPNF
ncbi:MAG: hypothetical protein HC913_07685 [Microscillaceae bacterium]|nr:hypothetical protein [Microscillaceae bacterium]